MRTAVRRRDESGLVHAHSGMRTGCVVSAVSNVVMVVEQLLVLDCQWDVWIVRRRCGQVVLAVWHPSDLAVESTLGERQQIMVSTEQPACHRDPRRHARGVIDEQASYLAELLL